MLRCEIQTAEVEAEIFSALDKCYITVNHNRLSCDFEHGQWFVTCLHCGSQWSVNDCDPGIDGFDFEQISDGDESCLE